jgi:hypothetical protein
VTEAGQVLDAQMVRAELIRLAEIAAGLLDGDEIAHIIEPRAMHHIAHPDTKYRFLSADYYDVDHERFLRTKKLLLRIERLARVPVDGSIWVPVPDREAVTLAVQNGTHHRYYEFGSAQMATPAEMREVFQTGRLVDAPSRPGDPLVTVLAPVRDSLGDVVAVVELTASLDPHGPAWS